MREIAIFTALRTEISPLKALLSGADQVNRDIPIYVGRRDGEKVILVCSGVGRQKSLEAAELVISRYHPTGVLSTGFCGGLVPSLRPSDVVLGSWVVSDSTERHRDSKKLRLGREALVLRSVLNGKGIRVHVGGFVTVSLPVVSQNGKSMLAHRTGALVVEMESFHLGEFFMSQRVPFAGMRAVFDGLGDRIPLLESITERGEGSGVWNMPWHRIAHRSALLDLWRLYRNGRAAQVALRKSVAAAITVWPQRGS